MRACLGVLALCLALSACVAGRVSVRGDAAHWQRTELYFSLGAFDMPAADTQVAQQRWQAFLDAEVTPRFPDGFSVIDAYGQWRSGGAATPVRERSRVLVILHEDTAARSADIDAIRAAYKRLSGEQSVLRASQPADVSF